MQDYNSNIITHNQGTPQGGAVSPLLANLFLQGVGTFRSRMTSSCWISLKCLMLRYRLGIITTDVSTHQPSEVYGDTSIDILQNGCVENISDLHGIRGWPINALTS